MDLDLEPHEYTDKAKPEPILHPRWKIGVLAILIVFGLAMAKVYLFRSLNGQ